MHRGVTKFKSYYQFRTNLVKDENGDLTDFHIMLNRWKNYMSAIECTWS